MLVLTRGVSSLRSGRVSLLCLVFLTPALLLVPLLPLLWFSRWCLIAAISGRKSASRARSMSFSSGYMSIGSWPKDIKMSDPIITAFM